MVATIGNFNLRWTKLLNSTVCSRVYVSRDEGKREFKSSIGIGRVDMKCQVTSHGGRLVSRGRGGNSGGRATRKSETRNLR